jgi:hypothetical protein
VIAYDTIATAIQTWIYDVTAIPVTSVLIGGAAGVMVPRPYAEVSFYITKKLGVDEVRYAYVATVPGPPTIPAKLVPTVSGLRELSVQIRVITRDNRPQYSAYYLGEKLLVSLKEPGRLATLQAAGISVREVKGLHVMPVSFSDRSELQAILDLTINAVSTYTPSDAGTSFIETAEISGTFKLDGATVYTFPEEEIP